MLQFQNIFKCKYPIFAAPMNKVSDTTLAIAVSNAGGLGSISLMTYLDGFVIDNTAIGNFEDAIIDFKESTGTVNFLLSLRVVDSNNVQLKNLILKYKIPYLELIDFSTSPPPIFLNEYTAAGILIFSKGRLGINPSDGIILKGSDGAGRIRPENSTLKDLLLTVKKQRPQMLTIVTGGIGTPTQVKEYLDLGATMVGVGTLFAASVESCVSTETKLKMVSSTVDDIQQIGSSFKQNALQFSTIDGDVPNHTMGLKAGMQSPESGLIFAGKAIDNISLIRPVADIIRDLVSELDMLDQISG